MSAVGALSWRWRRTPRCADAASAMSAFTAPQRKPKSSLWMVYYILMRSNAGARNLHGSRITRRCARFSRARVRISSVCLVARQPRHIFFRSHAYASLRPPLHHNVYGSHDIALLSCVGDCIRQAAILSQYDRQNCYVYSFRKLSPTRRISPACTPIAWNRS